jgi:hypothetical protein
MAMPHVLEAQLSETGHFDASGLDGRSSEGEAGGIGDAAGNADARGNADPGGIGDAAAKRRKFWPGLPPNVTSSASVRSGVAFAERSPESVVSLNMTPSN